jgi:YidC/Oxa1 family membrane protein insertase
MDRNALVRTLLIFGVILLLWKVVWPMVSGESKSKEQQLPEEAYVNAPDFAPDPIVDKVEPNAPQIPIVEEMCHIAGNRFDADLSTRGAALTHFQLHDPQYSDVKMVTSVWDTPGWDHVERWRPLRTLFREDGAADDQLKYDRFLWKLDKLGTTGCKFTYEDAGVHIEKTVKAGDRPFELDVETKVQNLADGPRKHRFSIGMFQFYTNAEVKGHLGRVSPFVTDLSCARDKTIIRKMKDDKDFINKGWVDEAGTDRYSAVSNYYFATALVPESGPATCRIVAEDWFSEGQKRDADEAGTVYHSELEYDPTTLEKGGVATYKQIAFLGPKERNILKTAGGPGKDLGDLINLGFFSPVAKVLVGSLEVLKNHVTHNWGLAIILLTVVLRTLLFPLTWRSIRTMVGMRRLKPEIDEINKKFKDDMQAKNLAMMELYKKRGINPFGGCLPQLVQMPVWFAMYTTLQTAVEMYHTHFLWFTDLSAPDQLFGPLHLPLVGNLPAMGPLPFILGVFMILQQKIVPQQGMDPMQQKLMTYIMPAVFMVMMLFLPAALGVYMLTNSILGIVQQLLVEKFAPRDGGKKKIEVTSLDGEAPAANAASLGKGKARV